MARRYEEIVDGLAIRLDISEDLRVVGDAELLRQLLSNLLDNAIRHTPPGGEILIRLAGYEDRRVTLSVWDTGPGVSEEMRGQLFQRFARGAGIDVSGVGLGLAIVADIVNLHRGSIELLPGPGARFDISLPRA